MTNYTPTTPNSTNYTDPSVNSTDYTKATVYPTNYNRTGFATDFILLQSGDIALYQDGTYYLGLQ